MPYVKPRYYVSKFGIVWWRVPFFIYKWAHKSHCLSTKFTRWTG
jgi:hypothetical protein